MSSRRGPLNAAKKPGADRPLTLSSPFPGLTRRSRGDGRITGGLFENSLNPGAPSLRGDGGKEAALSGEPASRRQRQPSRRRYSAISRSQWRSAAGLS
jgi:hypothetical protein